MNIESAAKLLGKKGGQSGTGDSKRRSPATYRKMVEFRKMSPKERFWSQIIKSGEDHCWNWIGGKVHGKYGELSINGKITYAHRFSWMIHFGEIPDGLFVCHKCDNPSCCNPNHLFLGTAKDNTQDAVNKGRMTGPKKVWSTKLTVEQVMEIRSIGNTQKRKDLATRFGVSKRHICGILNRQFWRHI